MVLDKQKGTINDFQLEILETLGGNQSLYGMVSSYIGKYLDADTIIFLQNENMNKSTEKEDDVNTIKRFSQFLRMNLQCSNKQIGNIKSIIGKNLKGEDLIELKRRYISRDIDTALSA